MNEPTIAILLSAGSFLIVIGVHIFNGAFGLSGRLSKMESRITQSLAEVEKDLERRQDVVAGQFGEAVKVIREQLNLDSKQAMIERHAIQTRVAEIEKWSLETFVKHESFKEVCSRIEQTVSQQGRDTYSALQDIRDALMDIIKNGKIPHGSD